MDKIVVVEVLIILVIVGLIFSNVDENVNFNTNHPFDLGKYFLKEYSGIEANAFQIICFDVIVYGVLLIPFLGIKICSVIIFVTTVISITIVPLYNRYSDKKRKNKKVEKK